MKASESSNKRWNNIKKLDDANAMPTQSERNANQEPITKNQKPIKKQPTYMPENFGLSERVIKWANQNSYRDLQKHLDNFVLSAQAKGYTYTDWDAALMKAIRENWAKVPNNKLQLAY